MNKETRKGLKITTLILAALSGAVIFRTNKSSLVFYIVLGIFIISGISHFLLNLDNIKNWKDLFRFKKAY